MFVFLIFVRHVAYCQRFVTEKTKKTKTKTEKQKRFSADVYGAVNKILAGILMVALKQMITSLHTIYVYNI